MSFLAPLALIGLSLIIPVLLLYMLRLRRREVVVSSTFLWQQVLRDSEANTPWQRLRRNLLLIIQLVVLILLVLALARPFAIVPAVSAARTLLLIDASLSMNAIDSPDGTRLAEARARAREIVETLNDGAEASILRVGDSVEVIAPYTADRAALIAALDRVTPGMGGADWDAALTLAAGTAGSGDDLTVVLISDGGALDDPTLPRLPGR
ncbi:MAG: VWA domain-containing protein, partial [Anaerolinea sp.]|nr:VWA domain-containing protein [Anaerolinea sp.]